MKAMSVRGMFAVVLALAMTGTIRAEMISGSGLISHFEGTFTYSASSSTSATINVSLTNTTPSLLGGHLAGFAFNNPNNAITGLAFSSSDPDFQLLNGSPFDNNVHGFPYGRFDIGTSTGETVFGTNGKGIASGETESFTFAVNGTGLDTLTVASFFATPSEPTEHHLGQAAFMATFRYAIVHPDVAAGTLHHTPEPGGFVLAGIGAGLFGLTVWRRYRRARRNDLLSA